MEPASSSDGEAAAIRDFRRRLRTDSNAYFRTRRRGADWRGWTKLAVGLALHGGTLAVIIAVPMPVAAALALWVINGLAQAFLLANVGHDAVHQAFTGNRRSDERLAQVMSLCGVDPAVYRISHVRDHHGVVNVGIADAALDARGLIRVSPHQPPPALGAWQAWLAWPVYTLALIDVAFVRDFELARRFGESRARLAINKALYLLVMLGLPLVASPQPGWAVALGFVLAMMTGGVALLLLFQVTHLVDDARFPASGADAGDSISHVLATTTDVAPDSLWLALVGGGLHTHVAHHLFPGVCHVHYPALTRIIAAAAAESGAPYRSRPHFHQALAAHHRLLLALS